MPFALKPHFHPRPLASQEVHYQLGNPTAAQRAYRHLLDALPSELHACEETDLKQLACATATATEFNAPSVELHSLGRSDGDLGDSSGLRARVAEPCQRVLSWLHDKLLALPQLGGGVPGVYPEVPESVQKALCMSSGVRPWGFSDLASSP
eukprot:5045294-Amphidinium_carterae.1